MIDQKDIRVTLKNSEGVLSIDRMDTKIIIEHIPTGITVESDYSREPQVKRRDRLLVELEEKLDREGIRWQV